MVSFIWLKCFHNFFISPFFMLFGLYQCTASWLTHLFLSQKLWPVYFFVCVVRNIETSNTLKWPYLMGPLRKVAKAELRRSQWKVFQSHGWWPGRKMPGDEKRRSNTSSLLLSIGGAPSSELWRVFVLFFPCFPLFRNRSRNLFTFLCSS